MKFHLMAWPSRPGADRLRKSKTGCAPAPFTSIFLKSGKVTPKFRSQKAAISASLPGSWWPNWSQGKPRISSPAARWRS